MLWDIFIVAVILSPIGALGLAMVVCGGRYDAHFETEEQRYGQN